MTPRRVMMAVFLVLALALSAPAARADMGGERGTYAYCTAFPPQRPVLILLDRTAALDQDDLDRLGWGWERFSSETVAPGTRIVVRTIADFRTTSKLLFDRCVPGCPPETVDSMTRTCDIGGVQKDRVEFRGELEAAMTKVLPAIATSQKPETALVEALTFARDLMPQRLIIFSDFIEYHPGKAPGAANFYNDTDADLRAYLAHAKESLLIPPLKDTRVTGFGFFKELGPRTQVRNLDKAQWRRVYKFWIAFFQEAGAAEVSLEKEFDGHARPTASRVVPAPDRTPDLTRGGRRQ